MNRISGDTVVMIGMPVYRDIPAPTVLSLLSTSSYLRKMGLHFGFAMPIGESVVSTARNRCANIFLGSDCTHLFTVDADMTWEPEDFYRVLMLCTKYPIVGATYVTKTDPPAFLIDLDEKEGVDEDGCMFVGGMGLGFTCVKREVIEHLARVAPSGICLSDNMQEIDVKKIYRDDNQGEDKTFFRDVISLGYKVRICPDISLGHVGSKIYRGKFVEAVKDERIERLRDTDRPIGRA